MTYIIGHRGAAGLAFENTLSGFIKAKEIAVDFIETDIRQTKDNQFVVFHDALLNRLSDHKGYVSDYTLREIKEISLNNGEKVMSLSELCIFCLNEKIKLLIELKEEDSAMEVFSIVKQYLSYDEFVIGSFFHDQIEKLKFYDLQVQTFLLFEGVFQNIAIYLSNVKADYIAVGFESCSNYLVKAIRDSSKKLILWTVDEIEEIEKALSYTPDGIISNFPDRIMLKK